MSKPPNQSRACTRPLPGLLGVGTLLCCGMATAHGVAEDDGAFIETAQGAQVLPYLYLGARHMVTGYDHLPPAHPQRTPMQASSSSARLTRAAK